MLIKRLLQDFQCISISQFHVNREIRNLLNSIEKHELLVYNVLMSNGWLLLP